VREQSAEACTAIRLAVNTITGILYGPLPGGLANLEALAPYTDVVEQLLEAYPEGLHPGARQKWTELTPDVQARAPELWQAVQSRLNGHHSADGDSQGNPWAYIKSAPAFLAEPEIPLEGLAKDLLVPGAITIISAPKGLGKTQVALALAIALATGGVFRGEAVKPVRVLALDCDNPEAFLKQRLRNSSAATASNLHVLTRQHVPDLKDREGWVQFPLKDYDALILDAVGSFTEGITEKEGRLTTEVLATLLDLARRGIGMLLLNNLTKDGATFKGREEWAGVSTLCMKCGTPPG
jgi:AAA domain